ncbi:MAG: hydroxyacid dehydrogenase [Armatimonadetes bacterium]|nr:hydroxyacid dehydrogenase [Armatimonadota bacterium]
MTKAAFFGPTEQIERVYAQGRREILESRADFYPHLVTEDNFEGHAPQLGDLEVIFSTWGMPALSPSQVAQLPRLGAVFYAAGSVQSFARPFLERGIGVVSGWAANGVPVAEWTLAQILLANKGYFRNEREFRAARSKKEASRGRGNFGATVSLLGAGAIGRLVVELLGPFHLQICVFDPFLSDENAVALGIKKVTLEEAFARGAVVSNHLANLPATVGMLTGTHFAAMRPHATFINTGRGATVREAEMIGVLKRRRDLTALLDVTYPEPPRLNSPLWKMENVFLTSHIAGSIGDEVVRMADYMIEEFEAWQAGKPLRYGVSLEMLETMA